MSDKPRWRVSAIIPAYNRADFLAETIGYLQGQTLPPHEIIVVDDGSTDHTPQVAAAFGDAIRYVRIENGGAPVARNAGAEIATGDWLWFCDSDDLWKPQFLERAKAVAATEPCPEFLFGNFRLVREGAWEAKTKFDTAPEGFWDSASAIHAPGGVIYLEPLYERILTFQPIFHSSILMSRRFFQAVGGYDPSFARTGSEDFEFTLRCVGRAPVGMVSEALVGIRRHGGNFSGDQLRCLLGEVEILRHAKSHHEAAAALAPQIDAQIRLRTVQALGEAYSAGDYARVTALAASLDPAALDLKARAKILVAGLPAKVRMPVAALARRTRSMGLAYR